MRKQATYSAAFLQAPRTIGKKTPMVVSSVDIIQFLYEFKKGKDMKKSIEEFFLTHPEISLRDFYPVLRNELLGDETLEFITATRKIFFNEECSVDEFVEMYRIATEFTRRLIKIKLVNWATTEKETLVTKYIDKKNDLEIDEEIKLLLNELKKFTITKDKPRYYE